MKNEETKKEVLEFLKNVLSTFKGKCNSWRLSAVKTKQKEGNMNFPLHLCSSNIGVHQIPLRAHPPNFASFRVWY